MENRIRRTDLLPSGNGQSMGIAVKSSGASKGRVAINRDGTNVEYLAVNGRHRALTAATTLTAADDGAFLTFGAGAGFAVTLPPTAAGLTYTFAIAGLSTSGVHAISPNANDKIFGPGITAADDKDLTSLAAADTIGDFVTLKGDGVDGWFVVAIGEGTPDNWAREA